MSWCTCSWKAIWWVLLTAPSPKSFSTVTSKLSTQNTVITICELSVLIGRILPMSWRRLQQVFSVTFFRLPRRLEDVLKTSWRRLANTSWRHLPRRLQDVFKTNLQDVFKKSWKTKNCYAGDALKTSSRRLEDQQMFAGYILCCCYY